MQANGVRDARICACALAYTRIEIYVFWELVKRNALARAAMNAINLSAITHTHTLKCTFLEFHTFPNVIVKHLKCFSKTKTKHKHLFIVLVGKSALKCTEWQCHHLIWIYLDRYLFLHTTSLARSRSVWVFCFLKCITMTCSLILASILPAYAKT